MGVVVRLSNILKFLTLDKTVLLDLGLNHFGVEALAADEVAREALCEVKV